MSETNWTDEDRAEVTDLGATKFGELVLKGKRLDWVLSVGCLPMRTVHGYCYFNGEMHPTAEAAIDAAMEAAK